MIQERLTATIWPWGTKTKEEAECAAREVSEIGYRTIESVNRSMYAFDMNHKEYASMLDRYGLRAVSFYFHIAPYGKEEDTFSTLDGEMNFAAELGAKICLQASAGRPEKMDRGALEYELTLIDKFCSKAKSFGLEVNLHPHYNTWAMYENEIDYIFQNLDSNTLGFAPDTAHLAAAGADPYAIIERYIGRVRHTHFKDISAPLPYIPSEDVPLSRRFTELGRGVIDHTRIFKLLRDFGYSGYLCEELDKSCVGNKESAEINYKYMLENY